MQKYKCDFCQKRSVKRIIEVHEKRCFRNPNRFCDNCNNTGEVEVMENGMTYKEKCVYCARFDAQMLEEIKEREAAEARELVRYCVECSEPVGENESMYNMHDHCRMAGVTGVF